MYIDPLVILSMALVGSIIVNVVVVIRYAVRST